MTTKQAIHLLHRLQDEQFDGIHGNERREALEMAVRALSGDVDMIYRQDAIDAMRKLPKWNVVREDYKNVGFSYDSVMFTLEKLPSAQPPASECWRCNCKKMDTVHGLDGTVYTQDKDKQGWTGHLPSAQPHWIPCSERLPEEDVYVLICYKYKEGEGDSSHVYIDMTSYGQAYFGGRKCSFKEWRSPFEYFHANYEVVAWMPLPEPYGGESDE